MDGHAPIATLRIGLIGSGFIAKFHLQALTSVRHVTVAGIYSPTAAHRGALAAQANVLELGPVPAVFFARSDVDFRRGRCGMDRRAEFRSPRHHAGNPSSGEIRPGEAYRYRLRKAAGAHTGRSPRDAAAGRRCQASARLSGKSGVLQRGAARQGHRVAPRRSAVGPIWRALRRSTAARICRGSGRAAIRAAASSPT